MNSLHLPILAISLAVILIALTLPEVEPKVTEPPLKALNCDYVDYQGRNVCKVVNVSEGVLK